MVVYGQASGPVAPVDTGLLSTKGCLYLTRVNLGTYTATRQLEERSGDIFNWVGSGRLKVHVCGEYPLAQAARAQAARAARDDGQGPLDTVSSPLHEALLLNPPVAEGDIWLRYMTWLLLAAERLGIHDRDLRRERPLPGALTRACCGRWTGAQLRAYRELPRVSRRVAGYTLGPLLQQQAVQLGLGVRLTEVEAVRLEEEKVLQTGDGDIRTRALIIATGSSFTPLGVPGEEAFLGRGVSHCAVMAPCSWSSRWP